MAKVLRSIMGRKDKRDAVPPSPRDTDTEANDPDERLQGERNVNRRVSISRSGRYKQRNKRRSGIWDNPQLVHDTEHTTDDDADGVLAPSATATRRGDDKENDESGSVRSKDSQRSCGSSVLHDTSQVAQELLELAEQQLREGGTGTNL